jgi:hypothetical protein
LNTLFCDSSPCKSNWTNTSNSLSMSMMIDKSGQAIDR